jgi:YfiH family protein
MILQSGILVRAGFGHGFGTRRSTSVDLPGNIHILKQVHGERIVVLAEGRRAQDSGLREKHNLVIRDLPDHAFRFDEGDALVTDIPGVSVGVRTADCLPVLVGDTITGAAAAIHCGWRSLALGLAGKGVRALLDLTGSDPGSLVAALGPSIGPCCCEVGEDVRDAFGPVPTVEGLFERKGSSLYLDLSAGAGTQLLAEGLDPDSIDVMEGCTSCDEDRFWSWRARRDEERMVSFIRAKV